MEEKVSQSGAKVLGYVEMQLSKNVDPVVLQNSHRRERDMNESRNERENRSFLPAPKNVNKVREWVGQNAAFRSSAQAIFWRQQVTVGPGQYQFFIIIYTKFFLNVNSFCDDQDREKYGSIFCSCSCN